MKVKIKTLTPIHIGTGKKLTPLDFFNNYRISYDKLFDIVAQQKRDEFFNWLEQNSTISANEIQRIFGIRSQDIVNSASLYRITGSFQKELNEGIKDSNNELFIPGSSLKGSLRTALMYKVLSNPSKVSYISNQLNNLINKAASSRGNPKSIKDLLKSADDKLEQEVFICGVEKERNNIVEILFEDQKFDLLKLVKISDSSSVSTYDSGEISELQVYALKKVPPHKTFKIYTESIKDNVELEFDISFDVSFIKRAKEELNNPNSDFGKKYFIGFEHKLKALFDIDIVNDSDFSEEKIINSLIKAWVDFGNAVSKIEKAWIDSLTNNNKIKTNLLEKLYNTNTKTKVGFGSGFSGMTILPLLLQDNNLKNKADSFYKSVGIGFHKSTNTPLNIDGFPFTRKYSNNQTTYSGFGWIKILNGNKQSESPEANEQVNKSVERPANTVIAEIIDDKSKPPKVKILEGEHSGKEIIMPQVNLIGLGLSNGSKVYVKLHFDKKNLQKAEFKGRVD